MIKNDSRYAPDPTSKTTFFIFHFLYNTKISRENHVYLFVNWLVQWWELYCIYIFFTERTIDFHTGLPLLKLKVKIRILRRFKEKFPQYLRRFEFERQFFSQKIRRIKEKVITFKMESRHESRLPKKEENVYVVYE